MLLQKQRVQCDQAALQAATNLQEKSLLDLVRMAHTLDVISARVR